MKTAEREAKAAGLTRCESSFMKSVHLQAGVDMARYTSMYERRGVKKALTHETWYPQWLHKIFSAANGDWKWRGPLPENEAVMLYGRFVRELYDSTERRLAVESILQLDGWEGVQRLVITASAKAQKKRAEAKQLRDQAAKLEAEADELDPPMCAEAHDGRPD